MRFSQGQATAKTTGCNSVSARANKTSSIGSYFELQSYYELSNKWHGKCGSGNDRWARIIFIQLKKQKKIQSEYAETAKWGTAEKVKM